MASELVSIIDCGELKGRGFTPFDDEGTRCKKTYLIKNGILNKRLHSCSTASSLGEEPTGNARAVNFEYEPTVRMTTTYIEPGTKSMDGLIEGIEKGIFVKRGTGMSDFTLNPLMCYMMREGKIAEPVNETVITGNVFETLNEIDCISKGFEIYSSAIGG